MHSSSAGRYLGLAAIAAVMATAPMSATAASAVVKAIDAYGYCFGMPDIQKAVDCAQRRCGKRSRCQCRVMITCGGGGHGAVFLRQLPGRSIEAIGAACGAQSRVEAYRRAARSCDRQARSNRCKGPDGAWFDRAP